MAKHSPTPDDGLIERIYQRVEDQHCLAGILNDMVTRFHAGTAHVFLIEGTHHVAEESTQGIDPNLIQLYHDRFQHIDPRFQSAAAQPGRIFSDVQVVEPALFERSDLYNTILVPQDARYTMFVNRPLGDGLLLAQALMRPSWLAPFDQNDIQQLERLLMHVSRAVKLRRLLGTFRQQRDDLRRALDLAPTPVAVVDALGAVVCANTRALALLQGDHGLRLLGGRMTAVRTGENSALHAALRVAVLTVEPGRRGPGPRETAPAWVNITRATRRPLGLMVLPLHRQHDIRVRMEGRARALVVFQDGAAVLPVSPALVARLLGLTSTEGLVAAALAEGHTVTTVARLRGSSEHTVRTHLKRIMDKTGTRRQADLVRLILSGVASVGASGTGG